MLGLNRKSSDEYNHTTVTLDSSDDLIVGFVEDEFRRREQERRPFELQWRLNIAFIEGNQYVSINPAAQNLEEDPKLYWWQEREVFNHIAPITETRIAKLSRMRPILKLRPGTNAQEDIRSAKVGTQLLKNTYHDNGVQNLMAEGYAWMEACGSVFMKHVWDRNKGPVVVQVEVPDEETGEVQTIDLREGDLDPLIVPPQEIYPDSCYRQNVKQLRSIIHARAYHIDEIEEAWGIRVAPEDTMAMQLQRSMIGTGGLGYGMGGFYFVTTRLKNHAIVKEFWEIPTKRFPMGRLFIVASKKLLYRGELPYPVGEDNKLALPFTKADCIKRPGCFFGRSIVERLIPVQRRYNALRNRKAEYLNRCAIGQWVVEEGAMDPEKLEAEAGAPGAVHIYSKGFRPPQMADNPELPAAFQTEENTLLQEMSMISGVSEISRQSNAPPGVKSGVALSIALEQDDTRLTTTASNIEQFLVESGKMWLRMYKAFVKGPRTLRMIGKNNVVELLDWDASDVRSDDVVVEAFSALAESPAQRRQMVFDLLESRIFDENSGISKDTRAKLLEMIELGNWEAFDDTDELHVAKAERENRAMAAGGNANAVSYDDHVLHVKHHNNFRLTTDYEEMLTKNPLLETVFQQHVNMHLDFMLQQIQSMQQTQLTAGVPAGGGDNAAAVGQ
ncbi:MAG: hypothetical protein K6U74_01400 [Firmicutes bacterium]|nr:hypothetical protein [Bacillota bacterium]